MLRKAGLVTALLLALPAFANAWTITAKVGSGLGKITTDIGGMVEKAGNVAVVNYFKTATADTPATQTLTFAPATGYRLSSVVVDGVQKPAALTSGTVSVSAGTPVRNHSVVAYYTQVTYSLSVTQPSGGVVTIQRLSATGAKVGVPSRTSITGLKDGDNIRVTALPNADFSVTSVAGDDTLKGLQGDAVFKDITYSHTSATTTAAFAIVPKATASIRLLGAAGPGGIIAEASTNPAVGVVVNLDASKSFANVPVDYLWTGATTATGAAATFSFGDSGQGPSKTVTVNIVPKGLSAPVLASASVTFNLTTPTAQNDSLANVCASCHYNRNRAAVDGFNKSRHWNNHLEYGPEFTDPVTNVNGILNANESYTTLEDGAAVTCSVRCHFKNTTQSNVYGCQACHSDGLKAGGSFKNASSSHASTTNPTDATKTYANTCVYCHSGSRHGKVPTEFFGSKHWLNNFEFGPEFANQTDTSVSGGTVTDLGTKTAGYLNANDSYTTTEDGTTVTCAYRCHFRPGMGPTADVPGYLADRHATTYTTYTEPTTKVVYSRPGGDACLACHDAHGLEANARSTCYTCHAGGNHGWSVKAFEKSSHFTGEYAIADGLGGPNGEACTACHNPHSTEAFFYVYSGATTQVKGALGCQKCHTPGSPYGVYAADGTGKAPHFNNVSTTAYVGPRSTCADCHGHNNTINAGWAEGGHGKLDGEAWYGRSSENFKTMGVATADYQLDPSQRNCVRCHTAKGFAQFLDSGFTKIAPVGDATDLTSEPLVCSGCHTSVEKGTLRLNNFTSQHSGSKAYTARYGYKNALANNVLVNTAIQLGDNRNSNLCMPCHSQRASGQEIKDVFAVGSFRQYSAGSNIYPHAAQPAAIFYGKGGYDFTATNGTGTTNGFAYQDRARHQRIGNYGTTGTGYNNTGITQGSCVGCHMTTPGKTHNLEIGAKDANGNLTSITSTECAKCHPTEFTYQNLNAKKAEMNALVAALGKQLVKKGITLDGINPLPERKSFDMSLGTKDNAVAEKNMGAWFNWYLFGTSDKAGYAHNPSYARRLLTDSIDWLDDNTLNNSWFTTIQNLATDATFTAAVKADALASSNDPGCMGCHFGTTTNNLNGEAIPGVQGAPHYNTAATNVPGQTFTQAQFVVAGSQCNNCHGYGHGTDSPSYSASKAAYPNISSVQGKGINANYAESAHGDINGLAWTDYNFLNLSSRSSCTPCHTTQGFINAVDSINANAGKIATPAFIGNAADTTKQVLGCNACHSSTAWKTSIRTFSSNFQAAQGGYSLTASANISYENVGESNVCIPCHAGRESGASINASTADFSNTGFKNPHYLAAAAVFYGKGGFQFYTSGVRYNTYGAAGKIGRNANWSHGKLGMDNYTTAALTTGVNVGTNKDNAGKVRGSGNKGQCVACHLGPTNTHTFGAYEVAKATWGTNATNAKGCFGCHSGEDMEEVAIGEKASVDRALDMLAYELEQYGIFFNNDKNPYFFTSAAFTTSATNWTNNPYSMTVTGKQTMGAAQNLKLLKAEKGSHVHNRAFMRALINDSLVYLQKGQAGIDADRTATYADVNSVINFTNYSTAITGTNGDRIAAGQSGSTISISALKTYLTRTSGGKYYRR